MNQADSRETRSIGHLWIVLLFLWALALHADWFRIFIHSGYVVPVIEKCRHFISR